jgi:ABC-type Na+ efflux pump permease subunit
MNGNMAHTSTAYQSNRREMSQVTPNERHDMPLVVSISAIVALMMLFYCGGAIWRGIEP